jgi:hypothetical protein
MQSRQLAPIALLLTAGLGLAAALPVALQDDGPDAQAELAPYAGTWKTEWWMQMPGNPMAMEWTTDSTSRLMGNWLISDYVGEIMPGMTYAGHDVMGYDATSGKWVNIYVDSGSQYMGRSESVETDSDERVMAGRMFDQMREEWMDFRSHDEWVSDDEWVMHFQAQTATGWADFMRARSVRVKENTEERGEGGG